MRRKKKTIKKGLNSKYSYKIAGGAFVPTLFLFDFCNECNRYSLTNEQNNAINKIINGYKNNKKVRHDEIHVVNEIMKNMEIWK